VITNGGYSDNSNDVVVVDVEQREAFYIAHDDHAPYDTYAIGWIVKP
jgi:hypothetical protein